MSSLATRLKQWISRRWTSQQWMVDRLNIRQQVYAGIRPRVLLSRDSCLYFSLDFSRIPAGKRKQALQQQLLLLSPFPHVGHYVSWHAGWAQLWIWDQASLVARLPQASRYSVLPDSALSLGTAFSDGERLLGGIRGYEWQRWQSGRLSDSRWSPQADASLPGHTLDLYLRSPLQAAERELLYAVACAGSAAVLLASLLIQCGAWLDLSQRHVKLAVELSTAEQNSELQAQARRRVLQGRDLWQARQRLFVNSQSELIARVGEALPDSASLWQRYDYQPGSLQILLQDPKPDPRDYVSRLSASGLLGNVQVQPEARNDMVTLRAVPFNGERP